MGTGSGDFDYVCIRIVCRELYHSCLSRNAGIHARFKMLGFEEYCSRNVEISKKMLDVGGHAEILVVSLETS